MTKPKRNYKQELHLYLLSKFPKLEKEFRFHKVRRWKFDWAVHGQRIAFEYEGMAYRVAKSGHTTIKGFEGNCEKYNIASIMGWRVLRFTAKMIENGLAFKHIDAL